MTSPALPTIDEVQSARQQAQRRAYPRSAIAAVAVAAFVGLATLGAHRLTNIDSPLAAGMFLAFVLGVLVGLPALCFAFMRWCALPFAESRLLHCVHCAKPLGFFAHTIGNCSHCGRRAIHLEGAPSSKLVTMRQFNETHQQVQRRTACVLFVSLAGVVVGLSMIGASVVGSESPKDLNWQRCAVMVIGFLTMLLTLLGMPYFSASTSQSLACPSCRKTFVGNDQHVRFVIATGNCPHCGRQVIQDALHGK